MDNNYQTEVNSSSNENMVDLNNNEKSEIKKWPIVLIVLLILIIGFIVYVSYFYKPSNGNSTSNTNTSNDTSNSSRVLTNSNCINSDPSDISKEGDLYKIDAKKLNSSECVIYKLDDDFTVTYEKIDDYSFNQYVNDKWLTKTDLLEPDTDMFVYSKDTDSYVHQDRNKIKNDIKNDKSKEEYYKFTKLFSTEYLKFGKNLLFNNLGTSTHDDRQERQLFVVDKDGTKTEINPYYMALTLSSLSIDNNKITVPYTNSVSIMGGAGIIRMKDKNNNSRELILTTSTMSETDVNRIKNTYKNIYNVKLGNPVTLEELLNEFGDYVTGGDYTYTLNEDGTFNFTPSINVNGTITTLYNNKTGDFYLK